MAKYYLYLDESGDFHKDLDTDKKNECVVGGLLFTEEQMKAFSEEDALVLRAEAAKLINLQRSNEHATELNGLTHEERAKHNSYILSESLKHGKIVVFENSEKTRFYDDELTYLNILSEGVVQLLNKLYFDLAADDNIEIDITPGGRRIHKAMILGKKEYTSEDDYRRKIQEKLQLQKVKSELAYSCAVRVKVGHDKKNAYLALCDYICNSRFIGWSEFRRYYDSDYVFSIKNAAESERMRYFCRNKEFDSAILEYCTKELSARDKELLFDELTKLNERSMKMQLSNVCRYVDSLLNSGADFDYIDKIIGRGLKLSEELRYKKSNVEVLAPYELDLLMYRMTVYSHTGKLTENRAVIEECKTRVAEISKNVENIDKCYVFYNRCANYYYDLFETDMALEILEKSIKSAYYIKAAVKELPYSSFDDSDITSDQLSKLLGTRTMCMTYRQKLGLSSYADVAAACKEAMDNLPKDVSKKRQYMQMAEIEALAGHTDSMIEYLCMAGNARNLHVLINNLNLNDSFMWLLLSKVFVIYTDQRFEGYEEALDVAAKRFLETKSSGFPNFITATNFAECVKGRIGEEETFRNLFEITNNNTSEEPLVELLVMLCEIRYLLAAGTEKGVSEIHEIIKKRIDDIRASLSSKNLPSSFTDVFHKCEKAVTQMDPVKLDSVKAFMIY